MRVKYGLGSDPSVNLLAIVLLLASSIASAYDLLPSPIKEKEFPGIAGEFFMGTARDYFVNGAQLRARSGNSHKIIEPFSGAVIKDFSANKNVQSSAYSSDGNRFLIIRTDGLVEIFDARNWNLIHKFRSSEKTWLADISPDGQRLLTVNDGYAVVLWDLKSEKQLHRLNGHTSVIEYIGFSPDGARAVTACLDGYMRIWDVHSGKEMGKFKSESAIESAVFSPDGSKILITDAGLGAYIWDVDTQSVIRSWGAEGPRITDAEYSSDGMKIVFSHLGGNISIWDLSENRVLRTIPGNGHVRMSGFSLDGNRLFSVEGNGNITVWRLAYTQQEFDDKAVELRSPSQVAPPSLGPDSFTLPWANERYMRGGDRAVLTDKENDVTVKYGVRP